MVATKSVEQNNKVTVTNNMALYYSDLAKTSADEAKRAESNIAELLEGEELSTINDNMEAINTLVQNISDIKQIAENMGTILNPTISWGSIIGTLLDQEDLKDALSEKADKSEIPTKLSSLTNDVGYITTIPSEYITEDELTAKGYLTAHQDISGKANVSDVYTKSEIDTKLDGIEALLEEI